MSFIGAAIIGGAGLVGSLGGAWLQSNAAKQASNAQVQLGEQALAQQQGYFNTAQNALSPYYNAGQSAIPTLQGLLGIGTGPGGSGGGAGPSPAALANNPVLKFLSQYGTMASTNALAARGLGASAGPVATAVGQYNTGLANTFWGNVVGGLQNFAGMGANAAGTLGGLASQFSGQASNTLTGIGTAIGGGIMGSANALAGGLTGGANSIGNAYVLSQLLPGAGGGNSNSMYAPSYYGPGANPEMAGQASFPQA